MDKQADGAVSLQQKGSNHMRKAWMTSGLNIALPTLLFYACYKTLGIVPAAFISVGYSITAMLWSWIRRKEIGNTKVFGAVASFGTAFVIAYTGEEKYYYVPALIQNVVFLAFMLALSIRRKSVLHYLAKDFKIQSLSAIPEDRMLGVNIVWIVYFAIKVISKVMGMFYLDFEKLYWLVFILGDPMTGAVILLSMHIIRKQYKKDQSHSVEVDDPNTGLQEKTQRSQQ